MGKGANLIPKLKAWFKGRPTLDVNVSATWFLLSFVYIQGLSPEKAGFDFHWSGILPVLEISLLTIALALLCLVISVVALVEPLLPYKWWRWTKKVRCTPFWHVIFGIHVLAAVMLGFIVGLVELIENLPNFSWLINLAAVLGFVIILVMSANIMLRLWFERKAEDPDPLPPFPPYSGPGTEAPR